MRDAYLGNPQFQPQRGLPARPIHDDGHGDALEYSGHDALTAQFRRALQHGKTAHGERHSADDAGARARQETEQALREGLACPVLAFPGRRGGRA